jgi:hypothetical protein
MFAWILLGSGLFLPTLHTLLFSKDRSAGNVARIYLNYLVPIAIGLGGLLAFAGHAFRADDVARSIGWPTGSPFQFEVAVANLAFGVLGLLSAKLRDGFRTATVLGYGIFLEGAAYGHVREILEAGNWSINNAGPVLVLDILFPILLVALLAVSRRGLRGPTFDTPA